MIESDHLSLLRREETGTAASFRRPKAAANLIAQLGTRPSAPLAVKSSLSAEVVLITHNSQAELERSLPSIQEAARAASADLLFIDLGSSDGTRAFAASQAPGARGVWLQEQDDLTSALLVATAASEADVLVLLRPTVQPACAQVFSELVAHLADHPYAALAAPAVRGNDGCALPTARPAPRATRFSRVEYVSADAIAIRRSELAALCLRSSAPSHLEELELCIKLRRRGREIHYLPFVECEDVGGQAALRARPRGLRRKARLLLLRHPGYSWRMLAAGSGGRYAGPLARTLDVVLALALILLLAPLLAAIALAIRLDSPGPALFRQRRIGQGGRPFEMFKFRSMRHGVESDLHEEFVREMIVSGLAAEENASRRIFKVHPDPRVTRIGRFLRRTSLDELPQLFNIMRGEMTFVGFRPAIPYELETYPDWYFRRFDARPGLTGLWQVSGRNERSYEEMVRLDIEYANRRTWLLDLQVLLRTVSAVISGRGAY